MQLLIYIYIYIYNGSDNELDKLTQLEKIKRVQSQVNPFLF